MPVHRIREHCGCRAGGGIANAPGIFMSARYFGARVPRLEDPDLLTGRGRYLDDIELPGTLEGAFVRSPHAHARISRIEKSAAEALPGVVAVFTAYDLGAAEKPMPQFAPSPLIKQLRLQH